MAGGELGGVGDGEIGFGVESKFRGRWESSARKLSLDLHGTLG